MLLNPCGSSRVGVANMHDVANPNPAVVAPAEENVAGVLDEEIAPNGVCGNAETVMDHLGAVDPGTNPRDAPLPPGADEIDTDPEVPAVPIASTLA
jgi:hypothetical protein